MPVLHDVYMYILLSCHKTVSLPVCISNWENIQFHEGKKLYSKWISIWIAFWPLFASLTRARKQFISRSISHKVFFLYEIVYSPAFEIQTGREINIVSFSATLFTLSIPNNYIVSQRTGTAKTLPSLFPGMAKTLPSQGWKSMNVYKYIQNSQGRQRLCHPCSLGWQSLCHPRDLGIVNLRILFCGFRNWRLLI